MQKCGNFVEIWKFYRNLAEIRNLVSKFSNFKISSMDFASEGPMLWALLKTSIFILMQSSLNQKKEIVEW